MPGAPGQSRFLTAFLFELYSKLYSMGIGAGAEANKGAPTKTQRFSLIRRDRQPDTFPSVPKSAEHDPYAGTGPNARQQGQGSPKTFGRR